MRFKQKLASLAIIPLGMILICSCSAPSSETTENSAVINQGSAEKGSPAPTVSSTPKPDVVSSEPKTSLKRDTEQIELSLNQSLNSLATSVGYPSAVQIEDATRKVASDSQVIELSPVETPTELRADSIQVAFAVDSKECIFGYIRGSDVSTSILPVLSNGKCMVGATP